MELVIIIILAAIIGVFEFIQDVLKEVKWLRISVAVAIIALIIAYLIKIIFYNVQ